MHGAKVKILFFEIFTGGNLRAKAFLDVTCCIHFFVVKWIKEKS
jgi:hypothetical protein